MLNAAGKGHAWLLRSAELLATRALAATGLLAALDGVLARLMAGLGLGFVRAVRAVCAVGAVCAACAVCAVF